MDDPGVGNERTALAWQRTALALVAGSAILSRITFDRLGVLALASVAVAAPVSLWLFLEGRGRYRHSTAHRPRRRGRGGRATLALAAATVVMGLTELAALLAA